MTNPVVRFWQNSLGAIPPNERFQFLQEAYFTNYYRTRVFAIAIFVFHFFPLYVDFRNKAEGLWVTKPGYLHLFHLHIVIEVVLFFFIVLMTIMKPRSADEVRRSHIVTVLFFILFILIWSASLSSVDQLIHGLITVYIIALFGVAVAFYVSGSASFVMYALAHVFFVVGISRMQANEAIALGNYINGSALALVAWILSRLVFAAQVREFLNTKTIESQTIEIEKSKERIESILKNILPENIVKDINGAGYPPPEYNASTSIVFADFVSFYKIAETSDAREVLGILEQMFNSFDETVRRHELEKLKTIGDCYMFAGGLFREDDQLIQAVEAALEMREIVERHSADLKERTGHDWALRIGIHTGPAITGIIGSWRFIYDVWGPTVNIASRLEAASLPGKINVSHQVYDELKGTGKYVLEPRGALAIKNMEAVEMYFVERKE